MWTGPHLLSTLDADAEQARALLDRAHAGVFAPGVLRGRSVATVFFEDSTRTRVSFSLAGRRLDADVVDWSSRGSSVSKGETLVDTFWTIESMGFDAVVVRHGESGAAGLLAGQARCAVINAGDGSHQHPTQALADALALGRALGRTGGWDFAGVRVAIVGDCEHSRVARSGVGLFKALGAEVVLTGPGAMVSDELGAALGCPVCRDMDDAIAGVDAVMLLRIQLERGAGLLLDEGYDYHRHFGLSRERAARMKPGAVVMHPGPMNRGVEIEGAVADGARSIIRAQVAAGVPVRMAALAGAIERLDASRA